MLLFIVIVLLVLHRRRWYGYNPYWHNAHYRGYGPYGPPYSGHIWNGYTWQPNYSAQYGYGPYCADPYGYYRRPYWR